MNDYPDRPGGALFTNEKKVRPAQPDFEGYVVLDPALMPALHDLWQAGKPMKIDLAGWKKTAQASGKTFLSVSGGKFRQPPPATRAPPKPQQGAFDSDLDDDAEMPF